MKVSGGPRQKYCPVQPLRDTTIGVKMPKCPEMSKIGPTKKSYNLLGKSKSSKERGSTNLGEKRYLQGPFAPTGDGQ